MKISTKIIKDDLVKIISSLNGEELVIPSFWEACKPSFPPVIFILGLQVVVISLASEMKSIDLYYSIFFSCFLCFFVFVGVISASGKYNCLPKKVRDNSLIFRLIKLKVKCYFIFWSALSIILASAIIVYDLPPIILSGISMVFMVLLSFVFNADMSRYNLSALSAAIATWRAQSQKD